jgi:hypothetical protein
VGALARDPNRQFDWPPGHFVTDPKDPLSVQYVPAAPADECLRSDDLRARWRTLRNATIQIRHDYKSELIDDLTGYVQSLWQDYKQELTSAGMGAVVALAVA